MKNVFKNIGKDSVLFWCFWVTVILTIAMSIGIGIAYLSLPPFIPLYNQMPWGYARLGRSYELFFLPAGIVLLTIINTIVGTRLIEKVPLLARFLFLTTAALTIFTSIFITRLIIIML